MARLFYQPREISVDTNGVGEPVAIYRDKRKEQITSVGKRWRVKENWWRHEVAREYFQIETARGLVGEIYQDMLTGSWYLHRMFD